MKTDVYLRSLSIDVDYLFVVYLTRSDYIAWNDRMNNKLEIKYKVAVMA
jgi:hypothetical protein